MWRRQGSKAAGAAAAVLLLMLAAHAANPAAAQPPSQQQLDELSAQCPVSVRYEMSLGQGQAAAPQVPIFVASVTLQNSENVRPSAPPPLQPLVTVVCDCVSCMHVCTALELWLQWQDLPAESGGVAHPPTHPAAYLPTCRLPAVHD
jgi:hypothetical protein